MGTAGSPIRCVYENAAYGAQIGVLECEGARVAVVLRGGALEAVAPMPGATHRAHGLHVIFDLLSAAARAPATT